jgi:hypothetical protein
MYRDRERLEWVRNKYQESVKHLSHKRQESRTTEQHEFYRSLVERVIATLGELLGKPEGTWDDALAALDAYVLITPGPRGCFYDKQQIRMDVKYAQTGYYYGSGS